MKTNSKEPDNLLKQLTDIALMEKAVSEAGLIIDRLQSNDILEVTCDIYHNNRSVCHLFRGWEDEGFRIAAIINIPKKHTRYKKIVKKILKICALHSLSVYPSKNPQKGYLTLVPERRIPTGIFSALALRSAINAFEEMTMEIDTIPYEE